jgi:hypothetical protein
MPPKKIRKKPDPSIEVSSSTSVTPEPDQTTEDAPSSSVQEQSPANLYRRQFDKPQRSEVKPLKILPSVTNEAGEVFNPGDKILIKAPWGVQVTAEIVDFYQDEGGNAWARYTSSESYPGWSWEGGCTRTSLLSKAE